MGASSTACSVRHAHDRILMAPKSCAWRTLPSSAGAGPARDALCERSERHRAHAGSDHYAFAACKRGNR